MIKVLLDEGVPRALARALAIPAISPNAFPHNWKGMTNGALLAAAEQAGFHVLLSNDKNIAYQQNLSGRKIAIVILPTNRLAVLTTRASDIAATIALAGAGSLIEIKWNGERLRISYSSGDATEERLPPIPQFGP